MFRVVVINARLLQLNRESTYSSLSTLHKSKSLMITLLIARIDAGLPIGFWHYGGDEISEKATTLLDHCVRVYTTFTTHTLCCVCCWPIRSFRAESHAARHTRSLLAAPTFSVFSLCPTTIHKVTFPPGPARSPHLPAPCFLSSFPRRPRSHPASHGPSPS